MKQLFGLLIFSVAIFSCKEELPNDLKIVQEQETAYFKDKTKETSAAYVAAVTLYNSKYPRTEETKVMLKKAYDIAMEQDQKMVASGIQSELIKQFPEDSERIDRIIALAKTMDEVGKKKAALGIQYFVQKAEPQKAASAGFILPEGMPEDPKAYLKNLAEKIFENADIAGLNRSASFDYVDATEAFVMVNPSDIEAPRLLYNAAEISKTIGTYKKSLGLYDWIISSYPDKKEAPTAQFLKAFILEDNLKNIDLAREEYEKFIANYPDHHFVDDAKFSLNNLGKTNEEIQAELERLQQQNKEEQ